MRVGINYAWKNYAWDFGAPPKKNSGSAWGARAAWRQTIDADLALFDSLGLFAVRWFLLGDGTMYGTGANKPHMVPPHGPGTGPQWRFDDPPALSSEFLDDFTALLDCCAAARIQLLPSLVDFHMAFPGLPVPGSDDIVKSGRADLFVDPHKRELFMSRVLAPLLDVSANYRDTIYAWEIINEPEWCTQPCPPPRPHPTTNSHPAPPPDPQKTVPHADMRTFIDRAARLINGAGFASTVGFAFHCSLRDWDSPGLGLSLHQFHYYAEPAAIPRHDFDPRWPIIVGEIATAPHRPWPELPPQQDIALRLRHLQDKGYPVTFLWSANREEEHAPPPAAVDFSPENRDRIRRYTGTCEGR